MEDKDKIEHSSSNLKISGSLFKRKNDGLIKNVYKIPGKIGSGTYGEVKK